MPATYSKRIWNDATRNMSIYVQVVDSTPIRWNVVFSRNSVATFTQKSSAIAFSEQMIRTKLLKRVTSLKSFYNRRGI